MFKFYGMKDEEVELELGSLITYMQVSGARFTGIILGWEFKHYFNSPVLTILKDSSVIEEIRTDLIFWCEVIS